MIKKTAADSGGAAAKGSGGPALLCVCGIYEGGETGMNIEQTFFTTLRFNFLYVDYYEFKKAWVLPRTFL